MSATLLLFFLVVLIAVNGFFVAAEFALVRARKSRMEELAKDGSAGAAQALHEIDHIDEYLSACQLGITLASIGLGFLGEPAIARLLEPLLGNVVGHGLAVAIAITLSYLLVTAAHVIVGEQAPKMMAITRAEGTLKRIARPLDWFTTVLHPFIWVLNKASNFVVTRIFGIKIDSDQESTTAEELRVLIARGAEGGKLDPGEAVMLTGVFHLHEQEARQVMTPIPAVVTVNVDVTAQDALRRCIDSGHTRLVVVEEDNPDKVRGIVHANGLARALMDEGPDTALEPLVRDALIMPETKPLDDLLADMQRQRTSIAVIVDEFGRTAGIVTIEDIIEEIVGEIVDETDPVLSSVRRLVNGDWFVRGHVSLDDLADAGIELPVDSEAYTSVGGYVFTELGRLPKRGDVIDANGFQIRVESVRENRIEAVRIHPTSTAAT
ncbi:MAG: hemolysin family protein [Solirubrobacterales bacterium]